MSASDEFRGLIQQDTLEAGDVVLATRLLEQSGSRNYAESLCAEYHAQAHEGLTSANLSGAAAGAIAALSQTLLARDH
jgi:geranylgeranyl pyrophosphate synthase